MPDSPARSRALSGIQPTGRLHWGNYFGSLRQCISLQETCDEAFYFVADLHSLTTVRDPAAMRENVRDAAVDMLALGIDPDRAVLFRQSDVPEVTQLTWVLLTLTPLSQLNKAHSYKDKVDKGLSPDAGLFTYPILMAADILLYDSTVVPVGADQKQHLEITRDLAGRFNNQYGNTLVVPEPNIIEATGKVPGTDGEKMSKSYNNTVGLFESGKPLKKKIMSIQTDSKTVEEPKDPETDNVFALYRLFADAEQQSALADRYRAGGMGYGDAKKELLAVASDYFAAARDRREDLLANPGRVEDILQAGAATARRQAKEVLERVYAACGLRAAN